MRVLNRDPIYASETDMEPIGWNPATYAVFRKLKDTDGKEKWILVDEGAISIGVIPLVPFISGLRTGCSWLFLEN